MKKKDWPLDAWQCPFCTFHASSIEAMVNHFRDKNLGSKSDHDYNYIRARFKIEPIKRYDITPFAYSGEHELTGYDSTKDPYKKKMKISAFETNRRKH